MEMMSPIMVITTISIQLVLNNRILFFTTPGLISLLLLTWILTFIIGCLSYVKVLTSNKSNSLLPSNIYILFITILWKNYLFYYKNNLRLRLLNPTKNNLRNLDLSTGNQSLEFISSIVKFVIT